MNKTLFDDRINEIIDALIQVGQGDYSVQIEISDENTEIDALAMGINMMIDDIRQNYEAKIENERFKLLNAQLQEAIKKAEESDRLKSAFLANMSHEIRTPMNGILGFTSLLQEPNLTGKEQQEYVSIIKRSGVRMLNIINDIVDISKIEAGLTTLNMNESNINEQIEYIYTFFKPEVEGKGIKFSLKIPLPTKEAIIITDREKLYAILTNLV